MENLFLGVFIQILCSYRRQIGHGKVHFGVWQEEGEILVVALQRGVSLGTWGSGWAGKGVCWQDGSQGPSGQPVPPVDCLSGHHDRYSSRKPSPMLGPPTVVGRVLQPWELWWFPTLNSSQKESYCQIVFGGKWKRFLSLRQLSGLPLRIAIISTIIRWSRASLPDMRRSVTGAFCPPFGNKLSDCVPGSIRSTGPQHHLSASWGQPCDSLRCPEGVDTAAPSTREREEREVLCSLGQQSWSSLLERLGGLTAFASMEAVTAEWREKQLFFKFRELTLNTKRSVQSVILCPRSEGLIKTKQNKCVLG